MVILFDFVKGINNCILKIQKADDIIGRQGAGRKSIADRKAVIQIPVKFLAKTMF
jgi:hypothetical protein